MEFPDLGKQCHEPSCRQLDFLPLKCDGCPGSFCSEHFKYDAHSCLGTTTAQRNGQIPTQESSRHVVEVVRHERQSDPVASQKKKVYSNKCSWKGCKMKEMIPCCCRDCGLNFCLKHNYPLDHGCTAPAYEPPVVFKTRSGRIRMRVKKRGDDDSYSSSDDEDEGRPKVKKRNRTAKKASNTRCRGRRNDRKMAHMK